LEAASVNWRSRIRLVDELAEELRERIYSGSYPLGKRLRQEELADQLQVSRTPLREALRVLESEGLVHSEPGRGVRVIAADLKKFLAAYQLREVVDGLAARLAAGLPDEPDSRVLTEIIARQRAALDPWTPTVYTRENVAFHIEIMRMTGNEYVMAEAPLVRMTSQVFTPVALLEVDRARQAVEQHADIAKAIAGRNGGAAERAARKHIRSTISRLAR
jgi:DNA-binding GntR family transcriptional regulator